jgi:hypothetical protein
MSYIGSSQPGPWHELVPPVYPEGDYTGVFCRKCGAKNRQDGGWRYRDDPQQRMAEQTELSRSGLSPMHLLMFINRPGMPPRSWPRLTYECDSCRDDHPATADDSADDEDNDEDAVQPAESPQDDAIAYRTRSSTKDADRAK